MSEDTARRGAGIASSNAGRTGPDPNSRRRFLTGVGSTAAGATLLGLLCGASSAAAQIGQRRRPLADAVGSALPKAVSESRLPSPPAALVVLNRLGYGPMPGQVDLSYFDSLGATDAERLSNFLDEQLATPYPDAELDSRLSLVSPENGEPYYQTLNKSLTRLWADHNTSGVSYSERVRPAEEAERAKFLRAVYSRYQLRERLADFWHDHFNIYSRDNYAEHTFTHWDRSVIRGHMLGNFRDFLGATAKHPAMLWYLDNYDNTRSEPNENYARELFELHTLGAENYQGLKRQRDVPLVTLTDSREQNAPFFGQVAEAYVDDDVYEAAACFTGWRVRDDDRNPDIGNTGEFYFDEAAHERTGKAVLSGGLINIDPDGGVADGEHVLDLVAYHPGTARHIAGKLCRRFISEDLGPGDAVVQDIADVFYANRYAPNQLELVIRALVLHPAFSDTASFPTKVKRPFDVVVSAMRACGADFSVRPYHRESDYFRYRFDDAGHWPFRWQPPDGYPDESAFWMNSVALVQAWRTCDWLLDENATNDDPPLMPIWEQTRPSFAANADDLTPENLVDFWMSRIFGYAPGGSWIGDPVAEAVIGFLTQLPPNEPQFPPWGRSVPIPIENIDENNWPYYWHERLRAGVGLILASPYFMQR